MRILRDRVRRSRGRARRFARVLPRCCARGDRVELGDVRVDRLPIVEHRLLSSVMRSCKPREIRTQAVHLPSNRSSIAQRRARCVPLMPLDARVRRIASSSCALRRVCSASSSASHRVDFVVRRWLLLLELASCVCSAASRVAPRGELLLQVRRRAAAARRAARARRAISRSLARAARPACSFTRGHLAHAAAAISPRGLRRDWSAAARRVRSRCFSFCERDARAVQRLFVLAAPRRAARRWSSSCSLKSGMWSL